MKLIVFLFAVSSFAVTSCSKETVNSAGRDVVGNVIKVAKWTTQTKTVKVGEEVGVTTEMLGEGEYLDFKNDGRAWTYHADGEASSVPYRLVDTKTMEFDGVVYTIQENIVANATKMTLVNESNGITTTILFKR